jgi:hypothetical protein
MSGPTCAVELEANADGTTLDAVDSFVKRTFQDVRETRKGRYWEGCLSARIFTVSVEDAECESPASVLFSAPGNSPVDYDTLRRLSMELAEIVGGRATEPTK